MSTSAPRTLFQKIWDAHIVAPVGENGVLLYIDRHLVNEVTSPQAFEGLRERALVVRRPDLTMAVADHNVPTIGRASGLSGFVDRASRLQIEALERNVAEFGVPYIPLNDPRQGIVHVVGPELGFTLPGTTIVCGDSHTSTHGAFGALAFGIGTSEVEQVLATQCIVQRRARSMLVHVQGVLGFGVTAKDLILAIVARIGARGAAGHVVEYAGPGISALDMSERMTVCNMSIEAGARAGMIAPDLKTLHWLAGRPLGPKGAAFVAAESAWLALRSDDEAVYDRVVSINASEVAPMISWGTSPDASVPITGTVPLLADLENASRPSAIAMMEYMGLTPGSDLAGLSIDAAFIGSCTNGRIEDLRAAASVAQGRRVATGVRALVVPGSGAVKAQAEREGLDEIFTSAGFEWRDAGCSMCLGMNADRLAPGQRCASSSNRNFEGRQGPGARTHLMSPAMVAAAAVTGRLVDVRSLR